MTTLVLPFLLRGVSGTVEATLSVNADPAAVGCDLLDPGLEPDAALGFGCCEATVHTALRGYAAAMGWVQLVRSSDSVGNPDEYEIDPLSLFRGVDTPYAFFGIRPVLFDAPFRGSRDDLAWEARSYLCFTPDAVMTRRVRAVTGFSWGFALAGGQVALREPAPLTAATWDEHVPALRRGFPGWSFDRGFHAR